MSLVAELLYRTTQGSVLGPLLFVMYVFALGDNACPHGIMFHNYVDETQLYIAVDQDQASIERAMKAIEA